MEKVVSIIIVLLLAVCCAVNAGADVIFEPQDYFYESHRDQCEYHDRSYTANGPNGDVKVYESPESDSVRATVENGEEIYVSYLYQDANGNIWGCTENWSTDISGWVPMEYLELIYDERSFEEDHGESFLIEEGSLSADYAGQTVHFWEYPGSTKAHQAAVDGDYMPQYQAVYVDANGDRWGRVGYYRGMRGWINLDDPTADYDTLYPEATEAPTQPPENISTEPLQEIVPQAPEGKHTVVILTAAAVAAIVAVTAVLLVFLKRKK